MIPNKLFDSRPNPPSVKLKRVRRKLLPAKNPDVASSKTDPATHYLIQGFREKRQPSRLFDGVRYLEETKILQN